MNKIIFIGITIAIIGIAVVYLQNAQEPSLVNSFEECVTDGNPVMESYPRQCRTPDGQHFVEQTEVIATDYTITEIIDGDTVKVNGESVRFALASAPEINENGGVEARRFIENLCPLGSFVTVDEDSGQSEGSYGRMIAVIYCDGKNLNAELLDAGLGILSVEFCGVSEFADEDWAQKHGCASNMIEKMPQQTELAYCDESYLDVCIAPYPPDLDCRDISHKNFRVIQPDPHGFDGDKDGIGCES